MADRTCMPSANTPHATSSSSSLHLQTNAPQCFIQNSHLRRLVLGLQPVRKQQLVQAQDLALVLALVPALVPAPAPAPAILELGSPSEYSFVRDVATRACAQLPNWCCLRVPRACQASAASPNSGLNPTGPSWSQYVVAFLFVRRSVAKPKTFPMTTVTARSPVRRAQSATTSKSSYGVRRPNVHRNVSSTHTRLHTIGKKRTETIIHHFLFKS